MNVQKQIREYRLALLAQGGLCAATRHKWQPLKPRYFFRRVDLSTATLAS